MYADELETLTRAYRAARKTNEAYTVAYKNAAKYKQQLAYMTGLSAGLRVVGEIVVEQEKLWQDAVLRLLEAKIMEYLSYVYPSDGYTVSLTARVLRGKVHVEGEVKSYFAKHIAGEVSDTQGRLFQQIVSFAALIAVMDILGVKTVYFDEAFSGAAKANIEKINALLRHLSGKDLNIIMIVQDTNIAQAIEANILYLSRSSDNKTSIVRKGGV